MKKQILKISICALLVQVQVQQTFANNLNRLCTGDFRNEAEVQQAIDECSQDLLNEKVVQLQKLKSEYRKLLNLIVETEKKTADSSDQLFLSGMGAGLIAGISMLTATIVDQSPTVLGGRSELVQRARTDFSWLTPKEKAIIIARNTAMGTAVFGGYLSAVAFGLYSGLAISAALTPEPQEIIIKRKNLPRLKSDLVEVQAHIEKLQTSIILLSKVKQGQQP